MVLQHLSKKIGPSIFTPDSEIAIRKEERESHKTSTVILNS